MYNTPPCWAIYMCGLVFNHMLRNGGIEAMQKTNDAKAKILYDAIDGSDGFYVNPIAKADRSNMNVPFTIPASQELEAVFVKEAAAAGMVSILHMHCNQLQNLSALSTLSCKHLLSLSWCKTCTSEPAHANRMCKPLCAPANASASAAWERASFNLPSTEAPSPVCIHILVYRL